MTTTTNTETPNLPAVRPADVDVPMRPPFVPPAKWLAALLLERIAVGGDPDEARRTAMTYVLRPAAVTELVSTGYLNGDDQVTALAVELVTGHRL